MTRRKRICSRQARAVKERLGLSEVRLFGTTNQQTAHNKYKDLKLNLFILRR